MEKYFPQTVDAILWFHAFSVFVARRGGSISRTNRLGMLDQLGWLFSELLLVLERVLVLAHC
jgi:hypothetical protein